RERLPRDVLGRNRGRGAGTAREPAPAGPGARRAQDRGSRGGRGGGVGDAGFETRPAPPGAPQPADRRGGRGAAAGGVSKPRRHTGGSYPTSSLISGSDSPVRAYSPRTACPRNRRPREAAAG